MFDDTTSRQPTNNYRRNSGYSQFTERYRSPPQHSFQPQSHFYEAPDINLGGGKRSNGLKPGDREYYCGFDTMNIIKGGHAQNQSVVISGYEGGLQVRQVSKHGQSQIASLGGLRGGVYNTKILPWTIDRGPNITRGTSLIAIVVHGPVLDDVGEAVNFGEEAGDNLDKRRSGSTTGTEQRRRNAITHYQTTVEVYCLRTQKHIATLLTVPKVELQTSFISPRFNPPSPSGALSITADAGNTVITSGQTGEFWVFRQAKLEGDAPLRFRCLGKFWTTVQQQPAHEPTDYSQRLDSERSGSGSGEKTKKTRTKAGLVSLRGRWLAFCPSPNIHQISLRASVDISRSPKSAIASLNSYAPPQLPSSSCAVDTPPGDDFLSRLGRQAAQGAITGANYLAEHGTRAWKSYWKAPTSTQQGWQPVASEPAGHMFPPTHSSSTGKEIQVSEAVHISIIDLGKLANLGAGKKQSSATVATFKLPNGCSYLSLSPSGLQLFTANAKGNMQFIWDLLRIAYPRPSPLTLPRPGYPPTAHVRQIARFSRLTVARIVDVVWTLPGGRTIAMVTERNTVHFLDIPRQAFQWPPPRRPRPDNATSPSGSRAVSAAPAAAVKMASSAFATVRHFTSPFLRPRGLSNANAQTGATLVPSTSTLSSLSNGNGNGPVPNRSGALAATLGAYAGQGGKMVASGITKSLSATMQGVQQFRRAGDNKLHLPQSESVCGVNCVQWLGPRRRRKQAFGVVLDGFVKVYIVQYIKGKSGGKGRKREPPRIVVKGLVKDILIPSVPDSTLAPLIRRALEMDGDDFELGSPSVRAADDQSRTAVLPSHPISGRRPVPRREAQSSIPMAEIETSTPYQPFHNNYRVCMFVFADSTEDERQSPERSEYEHPVAGKEDLEAMFNDTTSYSTRSLPHHLAEPYSPMDNDAWTFGGQIQCERLDTGYEDEDEEDENRGSDEGYGLERTISRDGEEPIISTTRRRKGGKPGMGGLGEEGEEGFFEDDLEWVEFAYDR